MSLNERQITQLLKPINPNRVATLDGLSHLESYDVRAHLIRMFGFGGWSGEVLDMTMLYEQETTTRSNKPGFKVAYRCTYRLSVAGAVYTETAVGESTMPDFKRGDTHDMAIKTAESQALKRCAVNLGDQFGLSLYAKGSRDAVVKATLASGDMDDSALPPVVPSPDSSSDWTPEEGEAAPPVTDTLESHPSAPGPDEQALPPTEEQVERFRQKVLDAFAQDRREAAKILARLQVEAAQHKIMNEPTTSPKGEPMSVQVLLDEMVKAVARRQS